MEDGHKDCYALEHPLVLIVDLNIYTLNLYWKDETMRAFKAVKRM